MRNLAYLTPRDRAAPDPIDQTKPRPTMWRRNNAKNRVEQGKAMILLSFFGFVPALFLR
jgi:hypothetical protein